MSIFHYNTCTHSYELRVRGHMQVKVVILNTMFEGAFRTPQIAHVCTCTYM